MATTRINFTEFTKDCFREVDGESRFWTQCFVDLNKEENPGLFWVNPLPHNLYFVILIQQDVLEYLSG